MKNFKKLFLVFIFAFMIIPFTNINASVNDYFKAEDVISSEKEINHSYFMAGNKITSKDKVDGILFMAGNTLKSKSLIEYGMFAGNVVEVTSDVEKDLFVAANDITVESSNIGRDVYLVGNTVTLNSNINGNVFIGSNTLEIGNITIKGDVDLNCSSINFGDNVVIEGTLKYNEDVKITGLDNVKYNALETYEDEEMNIETKDILVSKVISIISLIVITIIICAIFPKIYKKLSKEVSISKTFKNLLYGLCVLVLVPFAAIFTFITVIGIPIGIIGLLLYGIFIYLSVAVSATVVGNLILTKLFKQKDNAYLSIIIGILVVRIITLIPYIGGFIYFLLMLIGLGLILELLSREK